MRMAGECHTLDILIQGDLMKQPACLVCCSLLLGLGVEGAVAQPVTVQVTGHVTQVIDDTGLIGLYVAYSQPVTATYT